MRTIDEFDLLSRSNRLRWQGQLFGLGLRYHSNGNSLQVTELGKGPFPNAQSLCGPRCDSGVSACTSYSERSHGRPIRTYRSYIYFRADCLASQRNQHQKPGTLATRQIGLGEDGLKEDHVAGRQCGWDRVYGARFAVPGLPYQHTASLVQVALPDVLHIESDTDAPDIIQTMRQTTCNQQWLFGTREKQANGHLGWQLANDESSLTRLLSTVFYQRFQA
jgi:hypothetical protein